ncbi:MAG TPA: D-alanyl-D-alanine carboxypeptidase, partial [Pyrinomonadaceae bacterium]|nr:D-alanyl-D-alanine carboxypeptidase [Pyrinomonadaceae bacterium]
MNRTSASNRRLLINCVLGIFLVLIALWTLKRSQTGKAFSETRQEPAAATSASDKTSASKESRLTLTQSIDSILDHSELAPARWGVSILSLTTGKEIYGRNADQLFIPASNMKIYTTGVALDLLGSDYRWRTSAYSTTQPDAAGTINGDLILYGRGAPDLVARARKDHNDGSLVQLAENLYARGIRQINGNVIGDESYFRGET